MPSASRTTASASRSKGHDVEAKKKAKPVGKKPAHVNSFAFYHNPNSKFTAKILAMPNEGLCRRCTDKIEWRKKYRKYKPLKKPAVCNNCHGHSVMKAYHQFCEPCSTSKAVCPFCTLTWKEIKVLDAMSGGAAAAQDGAASEDDASDDEDESDASDAGDDASVQEAAAAGAAAGPAASRVSLGVCLEVQAPFAQLLACGTKTVETRRYALPPQMLNVPLQLLETAYDDRRTQGSSLPSHVPEGATGGPRTDYSGWAFGDPKAFPSMQLLPTAVVVASCERYDSLEAWALGRREHCVEATSAHEWDGQGDMFAWRVSHTVAAVQNGNSAVLPQLDRQLRSLFHMSTAATANAPPLAPDAKGAASGHVPPAPPSVGVSGVSGLALAAGDRTTNVHGRAPVVSIKK